MELAVQLGELLKQKGLTLVTAESCTGGLVAKLITDVPGSSNWFDRGFVTYSNDAKQEMLGIPEEILEQHGAVSEETAQAMALGALKYSKGNYSIAITGIAGPDGGTDNKPIGTVWFAFAGPDNLLKTSLQTFQGDRTSVRQQAAEFAIEHFLEDREDYLLGLAELEKRGANISLKELEQKLGLDDKSDGNGGKADK